MKTSLTIFIAVALGLVSHQQASANNSLIPFTTPSIFYSLHPITSFSGNINNKKVVLTWTNDRNQEANLFEVERSTDGKNFVLAALVFATSKADTDNYQFYEKVKNSKISYRIKVILKDGTANYSGIIKPIDTKIK